MRHLLACSLLVACGHSHLDATPDAAADAEVDALGGCGSQHVDLSYVPPNLLFVLDRSCSMRNDLAGTATSKWQAAVDAITHVIATYDPQIRWGATLFPDTTGPSCSQDAIPVPLGAGNGSTVSSMLSASLDPASPLYPAGPCVTNIDTGLEQAATDPGLMDPARKSYLMLVTDGAQAGCSAGGGNPGSLAAVQDLYQHGIATFVVGFGSEVNATFLNQLADAGGVALTGTTRYYQADTAADLDQAFQTIGNLVVSCTYKVDPPPPDLSQTYVIFDHATLVPQDAANGWTYDPATQLLTLHGTACTEVESHGVSAIDLVFGCPSPPIL